MISLGQADAEDTRPPGEKRLALVIGNGDYATSPLPTTVNDAGLIAQTLAQAGFDVTAMGNVDAETMRRLFRDFQAKLQVAGPGAVAFVYIAGYGVQYDGDNFVVPVKAKIARDIDVPSQAVPLSELTGIIQSTPARARMFVYDLARASPFADSGLPLAGGLSVPSPSSGTLIALNAAPGAVAEPDLAPYGVYARALAEMIQTQGLVGAALFEQVRMRVSERSNGVQMPFEAGSVDFVFYPSAPASALSGFQIGSGTPIGEAFASCLLRDTMTAYNEFVRAYPSDPLTARVRRLLAIRREALIWNESLKANTARAYWTYMRRYPRGPHFGDVRRKLAELHAALEPPPRFDIYDYLDLPPPSAEEVAIVSQHEILAADPAWSPIPPVPSSLLPPQRAAFAEDLPPPPIMPENVLPISVPVALPFPADHPSSFGRIVQPFIAGSTAVTADTHGATVVMTSKDKLISRSVESINQGVPTIQQTGEHDTMISRTTILRDKGTVAISQRGPAGEPLSEMVSRDEPDGGRSTTVLNGQNQLIAYLRADKGGVVTTIRRGAVPVRDQMFVLVPGKGDTPPTVTTLAQLRAAAGQPPDAPTPAVVLSAANAPETSPAQTPQSASSPFSAGGQVVSATPSSPLPANPDAAPSYASKPAAASATASSMSGSPQSTGVIPPPNPLPVKPTASPTGGATLGAIPPRLRQSTSSADMAAPAGGPPKGASSLPAPASSTGNLPAAEPPPLTMPSTPMVAGSPPGIAATPTVTSSPSASIAPPAESAHASAPSGSAGVMAPLPEPSPPLLGVSAASSGLAAPPATAIASSKPNAVVPNPAVTGPMPSSPRPSTAAAQPSSSQPSPRAEGGSTPAISSPPLAPGRAPTEAPPEHGPPILSAEMLVPSAALPGQFQPSEPAPTHANPPLSTSAPGASRPPLLTPDTNAPVAPTPAPQPPASSMTPATPPSKEPPLPPVRPGAETSAPPNPTSREPETTVALPLEPPLPPRRPDLKEGRTAKPPLRSVKRTARRSP